MNNNKIAMGLFNLFFVITTCCLVVFICNIIISLILLITQGIFTAFPQIGLYAIMILVGTISSIAAFREGYYLNDKVGKSDISIYKFDLKFKITKVYMLSNIIIWLLLIIQVLTHLN